MNKTRRNKRRKMRRYLGRPNQCAHMLGYATWQSAYEAEGRDLSRTMAGTEILMHAFRHRERLK